jgi:outer membrane protein assembly factor BamB
LQSFINGTLKLANHRIKEKEKDMKLSRSRTKAVAIALFLMFAMVVSSLTLSTANAQGSVKTYPYIGAMPNPVGVGQEVLLHVGITKELYSSEMGWEDLTISVERPDGKTETLGPFKTDATGGTGTVYVPTMAGNYTLQTHFPEQEVTATKRAGGYFTPMFDIGTVMLASDSDELTLVVQEEPITYYPAHALPSEYWTRPIDPQLREWSAIAGNWLETSLDNYFAPGNDDAPETAHVLWTRVMTTGGLVGEPLGDHSFEIGDAYEGKFASRFILAGRLYYNKYAGPSAGIVDTRREYVCVDLHTGEELWSKVLLNNLTLSFGQLMYWDTYDYHGTYDYLWASASVGTYPNTRTDYYAFEAFTGDLVYILQGIPSGTRVTGPKGEILIYNVDLRHGYMTLWNSTNIPALYSSTLYASMGWGQWRPYDKTVNATGTTVVTPTTPFGISGYQLNETIPMGLVGSVTTIFEGDRVIGGQINYEAVRLWGLNLNASKGTIGTLLFDNTWKAPSYWEEGSLTVNGSAAGWTDWSQEDMVGVMWIRESREHYGFSLESGKNLWGPTEPQYYLDSVEDTPFDVRNIAYGKLYCASVSGIVYCYDVQTGERLWTYEANDPYSEILWANNWWLKTVCITDGKIYVGHCEHSPIDPRPRGAPFVCLNATTGEVIWRVNGMFRQTRWGGKGLIGDSIIATQDTYDQRIYAIGKGPTATTITAPDTVQPLGKPVIVKGMVTDISPGTEEYARTARFPNGVPAVCDANMSEWMLYVYKQFERPTDVVGVDVIVSVVDPNNNCYEVGRATSDESGMFKVMFTPLVPGEYTVIASFEGSGAYYGSYAQTAVGVEEAPAATPAPTPTPAPMTDAYVTGFGIAIIIAIAIVGVLLLRRR